MPCHRIIKADFTLFFNFNKVCPTETHGNTCRKARSHRVRWKHVFLAQGPFFLLIPKEFFLFPVGEFVLPSRCMVAKACGLSVDFPASWSGECWRSFSWFQTSLLQRLHWGTVRWTWRSCSEKDSWNARASWKYGRLNKTLLWGKRSRERIINRLLHPLECRHDFFPLLNLTVSKLNLSLPSHAGTGPSFMLQMTLWCRVRSFGNESTVREKSLVQLFRFRRS